MKINDFKEELKGEKYTAEEVGKMLGITRQAVLGLIRRGSMESVKVSPRKIFITKKQLEKYINKNNRVAKPNKPETI